MTKNTWTYWINKTNSPFGGRYYNFRSFKIYNSYVAYQRELIRKRDLEESFTGKIIFNGFKPDGKINPINNWFGISVYEPDLVLEKGNKKILMSLQGLYMPPPKTKEDIELMQSVSCKYIGLYDGENNVYQTWSGQLPSQELMNNFLN